MDSLLASKIAAKSEGLLQGESRVNPACQVMKFVGHDVLG